MGKKYREFTVVQPGFTDTVKVRVYKTAQAMRNGAQDLVNACGNPYNEHFFNAGGTFNPTPGMYKKKWDGLFMSSMYGIIQLNKEELTMLIVSHECAHAAFAHERRINHFCGDYGEDMNHEERFCYYYSWLLVETLSILKKAGYKVK